MIQELLGGSNHVSSLIGAGGDQRSKLSTTPSCGSILDGSNPPATAAATATGSSENLRCPRCDSSNTKFCYYNNYNLTQPRHFCKTCRRYWTKGGALRNVPIGGGCRKNKSATIAAPVGKSSSAGKSRTVSSEMVKTGLFSEAFSTNPILWASSQNSHLLSLQRSNPNPTHPSNPVKDEGLVFGSHLEPTISNAGMSARALGLDPLSPIHLPSFGLTSSFYRNQAQAGQGVILGEAQNDGLQELYQRLRSSTSCYPDHAPVILGNVANSAASHSAILDSAPVATGEMGFWNSNLSWPADLPTTNGAYP